MRRPGATRDLRGGGSAPCIEELAGLYESFAGDPGTIDQQRLAAISAEMPAVVQRIAAFFGLTVTP
jgi:hypothetical protein